MSEKRPPTHPPAATGRDPAVEEKNSETGAPDRVTARLGAFRLRVEWTTGPSTEILQGAGLDQFACVYLDAPTPRLADEMTRLVLACQNGTRTLRQGPMPPFYLADTAIDVSLRTVPGRPDHVRFEVAGKLDPAHLTHAFFFSELVPRQTVESFWTIFKLTRNYIFTVAERGRLDLENVYVVKYLVRCRGRVTTV